MTSSSEAGSHSRWLERFFATVDRMDSSAVAELFDAAGGCFRFANHPALLGREQISGGCAGIFGLLDSIRHELLAHWVAGADLLVEGRVHYRRRDGFELSVPFMSVFEFSAHSPGPIRSYRVFVDSHALFQTPAAA